MRGQKELFRGELRLKMQDKRNEILTISLICGIILAFAVANVVSSDRLFSENENRVLAQRPKFTMQALLEGDYTSEYEKYVTDQFVSRDTWIAIKTQIDILLQKDEINGVYLGKDGYLIEQHLPQNYTTEMEEEKLVLLEELVKRWDADVMLVPTADNVITEKLPFSAPYYDQRPFLNKVKQRVGEEHYIDAYTMLREHSEENIYYKTDHHWTTRGAYYGYLAWAKDCDKMVHNYNINALKCVTSEFKGTLHSKTNLQVDAEQIGVFHNTFREGVKVTYDFVKTTDSLYEKSHLDTKNKYGYFLDDNHAFIEIETGLNNAGTLFVIKDSYANSMIPMLASHYSKIYVLDLRYFNSRLFSFMEMYEPEQGMDVLVLYNCIHFLEDFKYYK